MRTGLEIQLALFKHIQENGDRAHEIAKILNLGSGAVYKRLKGETLLNLSEIALLTQHYNILLDSLFQPEKAKVTFEFAPLLHPVTHLEQFLTEIRDLFVRLARLPGVRMYYSTTEIPFFHYLFYPELTAFKLYMWNRTIWELPEWEDKPFNFNIITANPRLQKLCAELTGIYCSIPSTEFWPSTLLNNTMNAVKYCTDSGAFEEKHAAGLLREQIESLILHQREMAKSGLKFRPLEKPGPAAAEFVLYHNEITHTNNTIMVEWDKGRTVFATFDNPNYMVTSQPDFGDYASHWFFKQRKRALLIAREGEKHRNAFFVQLQRNCRYVLGDEQG